MNAIEVNMIAELQESLKKHSNIQENLSRESLITQAVENKEAVLTKNGSLATWTPPHSTGRSPKDTYIVRNPESELNIDWSSANNIAMNPQTFSMIFEDALKMIDEKETVYWFCVCTGMFSCI